MWRSIKGCCTYWHKTTQNIQYLAVQPQGHMLELNNAGLTVRKVEPQVYEEAVLVGWLSVSLAYHLHPGTITVLGVRPG